jgi:hypothetical protein
MQESRTWLNIGNIYDMDGADYDTILQSYMEALRLAKKTQAIRLQVDYMYRLAL